jgi:putative transposase
MGEVFLTVADRIRAALRTRRDLLLEILALRHQLGVLSRSDRRFRLFDRLFWVCLRRVWPRWCEARVLVQPATVARWHRRGFHGWWGARSRRRPGRPRIESDFRDLIRRMSTGNRLWGAPRIHGELLKLGIAVSEPTVSRYLPDRTRGRSQTWRTFLTNHVGDLMCSSAVASSERPGDDDVVDTGLFSFGVTPTSGTAGRLQPYRAIRGLSVCGQLY